MNRKNILIGMAAGFLMLACDTETRNGELVLSGAAAVRIVDEGGKTVEFVTGPLKVEFGAGSDRKFSVTMSQGERRKAKFSGRAPSGGDWNFTLRGKEIGQLVDIASRRSLEFYGEHWRQIGNGGFCGFDGNWVVEEDYQRCNEDWKVAFSDADFPL